MGTVEQDLARYLDDEEKMASREARIIRLQEDWDSVVYHDPNESREYCYLIFERHGSYGKPLLTGTCIGNGYCYPTMDAAERACERAFEDIAEERVDNDN